MIYQVVILIGLLLFMANLYLNLRYMKKPSAASKAPQPAPLISVLIPARNEENNIRTCIESLQKQDYPNFEILVMDDNSDDRTHEIVSEMAAKDSRIKLYYGKTLPPDWAGKPFACYQLARKANGDWLLFIDADTTHAPHMLRSVLALAQEEKSDMLSGFNHQIADTVPQKIVMPIFYFIILTWAPLWLLHHSKKPMPSVAIGQFLLFSRDFYWRMGGHRSVKNRIVEDIWLGIEVAKHGGRHIAVDLSQEVSCHMYHNTREMWDGLGKSIYAVISASVPVICIAATIACVFYFMPFYFLALGLVTGPEPVSSNLLVIVQIAIVLFMRWMVDSRYREPGVSMWFHVFGLFFYIADVANCGWRWATGAPVVWKERTYSKDIEAEEPSVTRHN
jgi:chlorobactene glucosyltransferase